VTGYFIFLDDCDDDNTIVKAGIFFPYSDT